MKRSSQGNRVFLSCVLGVVLLAAGVGNAAQPASGDPLQLVPAESLFCVRINNVNGTLAQMDQFLMGILPFGTSMMAMGQISMLLGSQEPNGIDMAGNFAVFGPLPGGEGPDPSRVGVLVPVSDYQKFVTGNPNVAKPDAQGISLIGPEGEQELAAVKAGEFALVTTTGNKQALTEAKNWMPRGATSLAQRLDANELKRAQGSPAWAYLNIQTASKMFGPMIQAKIQEAKEMSKQMQEQGGPPMMGRMEGIMDGYASLLNTLMQEAQSASLTLTPNATALNAGLTLTALPETELAKTLKGGTAAPDRSFVRYVKNGAMASFIASVDSAAWTRINDMAMDMFAKMIAKGATDPQMTQLKKLAADATNALGGTLAGSFSVDATGKPPFAVRYVVGLKDPQAFNRVMEETPKLFNSGAVADFYKDMGLKASFEIQRKAETYKGVPVDAIKVSFTATDPNSQEAQMVTMMYGQGMNGRIAVVNNLLVYAFAGDPNPVVREMIDQVKAGGTTATASTEVDTATKLIPAAEKADFFMTFNLLRAFQMASAMLPMGIPPVPAQSQSNIAVAGNADGGKLSIELAVPKQHVTEIMTAFMQMQQGRR
ncbi:MAG TPA: hypothetical protein PKH24_19345 [Sedimentisphaerales bacterium]|nr:hypothetical protein [Sedimentisphaerales bacterium]HNU31261.1 hypothetical protein [Sedimentisphaerales bacterium]